MDRRWVKTVRLRDLDAKGPLVVRPEGRQIALFLRAGSVHAINNRCPHEGYPLCEGTLDESGVVTCNWHNWKFDLADGRNLYGGEGLRVYPAEVRGGDVWLDLSDPPFEVLREAALGALREAFEDNDYQRVARELARFVGIGADPLDAVREAIRWSWSRMEFGWTHAFAGLADWLDLRDEHGADPELALACLLEPVAHMADDVLREEEFHYPDGTAPFDEDALAAAIEAEDEPRAVALVRGALAEEAWPPGLERALSRAALAHYNDFGHSLIYVTKCRRLVQRLGPGVAEPLVLSLVREHVFARREDLIPEFRGYGPALAAWSGAEREGLRAADFRKAGIDKALALAGGSAGDAPGAASRDVAGHAPSSRRPATDEAERRLFEVLLEALALHFLRFDIENQDRVAIPVSGNVGWLDFTHGITFAAAVWELCRKYPELWPAGLLQMACFVGRNTAFTVDVDPDDWAVEDPQAFLAGAVERLFDHGVDEFIVSVHLLKTTLAVRTLVGEGFPASVQAALLAALNRFLSSPLKRKQVRRTVHQAIGFVAKDLPPRADEAAGLAAP